MHSLTPAELGGLDRSAVVIGPFGSSLKTSDFRDSGVPLIFVRDIRTGDFSKPRAFVSEEKARELKAHLALPGDLVVTKMGDPPGDVAIYDGHVPAVITADCIRLRPTDRYDQRYLLHAFRAPQVRQQVLDITSGAAQKKMSLERFRTRVAVPVPSPDEQRRIAGILDHADNLRAKRRRVLAHLDSLAQSVFHDMFGHSEWRLATLDEVSLISGEYGANVPSTDPGQDLPRYVRITDITSAGDLIAEARSPGGQPTDWERYRLEDGDLLFARSGATVGKTYRHRTADGECVFAGYLIRYRPDQAKVDPDYLFGFTKTANYLSWVAARQNVVAQPNINAKQYGRELAVPLPPVDLQRAYAARVHAINSQRTLVREAQAREDAMFTSLQSRAFRGEL